MSNLGELRQYANLTASMKQTENQIEFNALWKEINKLIIKRVQALSLYIIDDTEPLDMAATIKNEKQTFLNKINKEIRSIGKLLDILSNKSLEPSYKTKITQILNQYLENLHAKIRNIETHSSGNFQETCRVS